MTRGGKLKLGAAVVLILGVAYAAYYARVEVQLRKELRLFREAGFPTSREELLAMYTAPAEPDNGAAIVEAAFALYPEDSEYPAWDRDPLPIGGGRGFPDASGPLPDEVRQAINDYLSAHRQAISLLHEGARKSAIQFTPRPGKTSDGPLDMVWHVRPVLKGVDALLLEAALHGDDGDARLALDSMIDAKDLTDSLEHLPGSFASVILARCQRNWTATLAYLCGRQVFGKGDFEVLASHLVRSPEVDPSTGLLAEHGAVVETILNTSWSDVRKAVDSGGFEIRSPGRSDWAGNLLSATYLAVYVPARLHCRDAIHYMGVLRQLAAAENESGSLSDLLGHYQRAGDLSGGLPPHYRACRTMIPGLGHAARARLSARALLPCARVGLAVEAHRDANGDVPESLDDLVPGYLDAVPADPWAQQNAPAPLRYNPGPDGYTVYSVGVNGTDEGGNPDGGGARALDQCFVVGKGGPLPVAEDEKALRTWRSDQMRRLGGRRR